MNRKILFELAGTLLLFLLFLFVFYYIAFSCGSDLPAHAKFAVLNLNNRDLFSGNFLFYFLINICSGFSCNIDQNLISCCMLLSASKVFLFWIVFLNLKEQFGEIVSLAISFSLLFVTVVPFNLFLGLFNFYFGYLVPNVWHNSTIIFSMPFCVLIFINSLQILKKINWNQVVYLSILVLICVMIKPSFFFVYSCSFSLVVLYKFGPDIRKIFLLHIPILIGLMGLVYQYLTIYDGSDGSSIIMGLPRPFLFNWSIYGLYILVSLIFPLSFFILSYRRIKINCEFWLVCLMLIFSIFVVLVFRETGPRAYHGNFYWQVIPSMWIVYFYTIKSELGIIKRHHVTIRNKCHAFIVGYYFLTFMFGLVYITKYLYYGTWF